MVDADTERRALAVEAVLIRFRHLLDPRRRRTYCDAKTFPVTTDVAHATCHACLEALEAYEVERCLREPPPIGEPTYAGATATRREVERAATFVAPWAVEVWIEEGTAPWVVVVILSVAEDLEYYQDHAHLVAERLHCALPAGAELRVEIELAESRGG